MAKFSGNFRISLIVLAVGFILLVPLVAMQITEEVDWSAVDFVVAGALLLGAGFSYELVARKTENAKYKIAAGFGIFMTVLLIWAELAVGIF